MRDRARDALEEMGSGLLAEVIAVDFNCAAAQGVIGDVSVFADNLQSLLDQLAGIVERSPDRPVVSAIGEFANRLSGIARGAESGSD